MLSESIETDPIKWLAEHNGEGQQLIWSRLGGVDTDDLWTVIPLLKSVGGGAGIFDGPPGLDEGQSREISVLSVDPAGSASRKKVTMVIAEIPKEGFAEMIEGQAFRST